MASVHPLAAYVVVDVVLAVFALYTEWAPVASTWWAKKLGTESLKGYSESLEDDTVPSWVVIVFLAVAYLPCMLLMGGELSSKRVVLSGSALERQKSSNSVLMLGKWTPLAFYTTGVVLLYSVLNVLKITVGRPRPCFSEATGCTEQNVIVVDGSTSLDLTKCKIEGNEFFTSGEEIDRYIRSFPSGHSALTMYPAMFIALDTMRGRFAPIGWLLIVLSLLVGASRRMDHRHFWSDITVGLVLGACSAFATHSLMMRAPKHEGEVLSSEEEKEPSSSKEGGESEQSDSNEGKPLVP